jgi:Tfp pilus assembly PilM family ATPase
MITGAALEPVAPGLIEPRFTELNIKDKDRVSGLIRQAVEKAGLQGARRWSLAIPRKATRTLIIQLDEAPKSSKELAEVLQWKVERLLEVTLSDLTAAFQRLEPINGQPRYLVVAAGLGVLASYEAVLAPMNIQAGFVIPTHLAETAWLQLHKTDQDTLLIAAPGEELTIVFLRGGDFLSIRSVEFDSDSLSDEIHRTLVYYLDRVAPQGESGPEPQLETVLLIGSGLRPEEVEASCQALFSADRQPAVHTLREEKLEGHHGLTLEAIASAAGLAAMGL